MVPFAGFNMPVEYTGINEEHLAVRSGVGIFDVSHMGEIWIKGPHALDLVQKITTNDASVLIPGKAQYSCMPNGKGGVVDDIIVYFFEKEKYLLIVNASNIEKDWEWIQQQNAVGAILENASDHMAQLAVQGPLATTVLQRLTSVPLQNIPYYHFTTGPFAGVSNVIISNTGYTGAGGFELYFYPNEGMKIMNALLNEGKNEGIRLVGLAARDTLRLEMGYCLYGHELNDTTSPLEAGLGWITKFLDYKDFIDKDYLLSQKTQGVKRKLVGFELIDKGIPRQGYEIENNQGETIGVVTSGTMSPSLKIGIGMGYVATSYSNPGTEILISIRNKKSQARVVKLPFLKRD